MSELNLETDRKKIAVLRLFGRLKVHLQQAKVKAKALSLQNYFNHIVIQAQGKANLLGNGYRTYFQSRIAFVFARCECPLSVKRLLSYIDVTKRNTNRRLVYG